jgi:hypothetical protein
MEQLLTHKRADASNNPDYGYIATANGNDVYGYCYSMTADDTFRVNLTESQSFAVDDKIRLFIPVRAGEPMFVDHILATVYGEHLVTAVNFSEQPAPTTSYSTIGENEARIRMRVGSVRKQNIWNSIAVDKLEASERERPNLPKGTQTFSFSGTWSYPANNIVQWTAGDLRTADGEVYQIAASNTSDTTYGLGASGMTGSNDYTVYVDPEGENSSGNIYHLYTVISTSYLEDDDNIVVLKTSVGSIAGKANAVAGPNMDLSKTDIPKWEAFKFAHDESVIADLVKAGTLTGNKLVNNTITVTQIGDNSISTAKIQANAITSNEIVTNAITSNKIIAGAIIADKIDANQITATHILAGEITSEKMNANSMNAHTFTLTGAGKFRTAAIDLTGSAGSWALSGAGLSMNPSGIFGASGSGTSNMEFYLQASNGLAYFGGGICTIGKHGIYFPPAADGSSTPGGSSGAVEWEYNSKSTWLYRITGTNRMAFTSNVTTNTDAALTLIGMTLGNSSWKVPAGYFTALYTDSFTISGSTLSLGGSSLGAGDILLLTNGSTTDAQSLHTHGNLGGSGGVAVGDSPTWTGNHNFNGNVYMNGGTIHIGNASADTVTIDAKIAVGGYAAPGLRWNDGGAGAAGMYFEDSGGYSRTKFVGRGQTAYHGYFSSDGTYSYVWASSVTGNYTYANTAFRAPDGSAGATSYSFSGATNSGLFRSSGNYVGIAYGGGVKLEAQANYVVLNQKLRLLDIASSTGTALMIDGSGDVVQSSSTQRAKMNIRDLEFDSAPIYDINLKSFEMRNQYDDGNGKLQWGDEAQETSFGMIAEEVHLLLPQLVSLDNEGLPISINYPLLSVLLVGELKKLRARIEILEGN